VFDRLTRRASTALQTPIALLTLVDADRQFFKSGVGLPEPVASERQTPLSYSFCKHAVASGSPLLIGDVRDLPLVRDNLAIPEFGVVAYAGIPLLTADGDALGTLCVIDTRPRSWTQAEVELLEDLAAAAMTEIERHTTDAADLPEGLESGPEARTG
jgi:GAF domain-containing protein